MRLGVGARLGPYEIVSVLGAGGMGEVYRARDSRLGRDVALKVLPDLFAADGERLARFEREAQLLASLNHPNIGAIHGLEESLGVRALVLELVEGETLADRLRRGPLALDESLRIALQIAAALEAAHEKGIIHRDLKPANIILQGAWGRAPTPYKTAASSADSPRASGEMVVKVLDFGLAKAMERAPAEGQLSHSPTLTIPTGAGVILGTAAYMSPEQAKGFQADQRSDIFSFGCVLYEMLTGRQAFHADTATEILAAVLMHEPDLNGLPNVNPKLHELVRRCLEKNPRRRWQAIGDVRFELETIAADPHGALALVTARPEHFSKRAIPTAVAVIAVGVAASLLTWWVVKPGSTANVARFALVLPEDQQFTRPVASGLALSPDGTRLTYVASRQLYLRSMADMEARPIPGTNLDVASPFFSPDGQWIAFFSFQDLTLKKIAVSGGAPLTLCKADMPFGASWDGDQIVFAQARKGIMRVSDNGGEAEILAAVNAPEIAHGPHLLDRQQALLFTVANEVGQWPDRWDNAQIVVQSLASGERKVVVRGGSDARYVTTGHLVYALGGTLLAIPFDLEKREVTGGPVSIVEGVARAASPGTQTGTAQFAVSTNGSLAYIPGTALVAAAPKLLRFVDRNGKIQPLELPPQPYVHPRLSPDGNQLVVGTDDGKDANVWVYDLKARGSLRRLTFGGRNQFPIWSRDGRSVTFQSDREGDRAIFRQPAGGGTAERVTKPEPGTSHEPESWSPDGRTLSLNAITALGAQGVWMMSVDGDGKAKVFIDVPNLVEKHSVFSPDGRWLAYMSTSMFGTSNTEVFVQPFPPTGATYQISTDVGRTPLWSPDGKQLFYHHSPTNRLLAVDIRTEPSFAFGKPTPLPIDGTVHPITQRNYDITPDGKQFLVVVPASIGRTETSRRPAQQINIVLNWFEELKTRVPVPR